MDSRYDSRYKQIVEFATKRLLSQLEKEIPPLVWSAKKSDLEEQIKEFRPIDILNTILERYSWVIPDLTSYRYGLSIDFLSVILYSCLCRLDPNPIKSWKNLEAKDVNKKLAWKSLEAPHPDWLLKRIDSFFDSNISFQHPDLYTTWDTTDFTNTYSKVAFTVSPLKTTALPSRLDVIRALHHYAPEEMKATDEDDTWCVKYTVRSWHELQYLHPKQLDKLSVIIVNISDRQFDDEEQPIWIPLRKEEKGWQPYVPFEELKLSPLQKDHKHLYGDKESISKKLQGLKSICLPPKTINYNNNAKLNNIEISVTGPYEVEQKVRTMHSIEQWNTVVLTRAIPCFIKGKNLDTFRATVPMSSLYLEALEVTCASLRENIRIFNAGQETPSLEILHAFLRRKPFSNLILTDFMTKSNTGEEKVHLLLKHPFHQDLLLPQTTLKSFDTGAISIDPTLTSLTLNVKNPTEQQMVEALYHIYHNNLLTVFSYFAPNFAGYPELQQLIADLFDYNVNIQTINPQDVVLDLKKSAPPQLKNYHHALQCAARNRFLSLQKFKLLDDVKSDTLHRKKLWESTGEAIVDFFRNSAHKFAAPHAQQLLDYKVTWHGRFCDHQHGKDLYNEARSFLQIAEMGTKGLDHLFEHLEKGYANLWMPAHQEPSPSLPAVFDFTDSLVNTGHEYIQRLTKGINSFDKNKKGCKPLFASFSGICPTTITQEFITDISALIQALDTRKKQYPEEEMDEIQLHHLDLQQSSTFLHSIWQMAEYSQLQILIRIPAWDSSDDESDLLNFYRQIQNKILENQRVARQQQLQNIAENKKSDTTLPIEYKAQSAVYKVPLKPIEGFSSQLQVALEQEQEQEVEQEQAQDIALYKLNEQGLITRANMNQLGKPIWDMIPARTKEFSGSGENLEDLFSLWVGSNRNAPNIIEKMEPAAVKELMTHAADHRFNISLRNLPPGFYLAYSQETGGLILCFNERQKKDALRLRREQPEKVNVFTNVPHDLKREKTFAGDYRQFNVFSDQIAVQKNLWHCLSSTAQAIEAIDYKHCVDSLRNWASKKKISPTIINLLFQPQKNEILASVGQLFFHFGSQGIHNLLLLASQVLEACGPDHFKIWKERLLEPSTTLTECLNNDEVKAVRLSIATLTEPHTQEMWWSLVHAHGKAIGHMQYAPLWQAFSKFLDYIRKESLTIDKYKLFRFFADTANFNGIVFLDRLFNTLKLSQTQRNSRATQQHILDNIDEIDWTDSGFYFAKVVHQYTFWDKSLYFTQLKHSMSSDDNYHAAWPADVKLEDPKLHALRFAARFMRLDIKSYQLFQRMIAAIEPIYFIDGPGDGIQTPKDKTLLRASQIMRLFVACHAIGIDKVDDSEIKDWQFSDVYRDTNPEFAKWLNQSIALVNPLYPETLQLQFVDIPILSRVIHEFKLPPQLVELNDSERLQFINSCGKILSYTGGDKLNALKQALTNQNLKQWVKSQVKQQKAGFMRLKNHKKLTAARLYFETQLKPVYRNDNLILIDRFFKDHIAFDSQKNLEIQINDLRDVLLRIDNNKYYNELGNVLGKLISRAKPDRAYSIIQLTAWLERLINPDSSKHFSVDVLDVVLSFYQESKPNTLFNSVLSSLSSEIPNTEQEKTESINKSAIPNQCKPILTQLALEYPRKSKYIDTAKTILIDFHKRKISSSWLNALSNLIVAMAANDDGRSVLENLSHSLPVNESKEAAQDTDALSHLLWQNTQIKLSEWLVKKKIQPQQLNNFGDSYLKIILVHTVNTEDVNLTMIGQLKQLIENKKWPENQLRQLAHYFSKRPMPKLTDLIEILTQVGTRIESVETLIHVFESITQSIDRTKQGWKRVEQTDEKALRRIVSQFKCKGKGIIKSDEQELLIRLFKEINECSNSQSLKTLKSEDLKAIIDENRKHSRSFFLDPDNGTYQSACVKIFACMRELLLRKTGKWANHTQMLSLLYSALHNDDNMFQQVQTGQGKSLISIMHVAFLALNGKRIDLFSAKDSLSIRDYEEFSGFLDALGIANSYINLESPGEHYKDKTDEETRIGCVNFAYSGSLSLFLVSNIWNDGKKINIDSKGHIAYLDECDFVSKGDKTQFNLPIHRKDFSYNSDEWVYKIVYKYYKNNLERFKKTNCIQRTPHLEELYKLIQDFPMGAEQSSFIQTYFTPTLNAAGEKVLTQQLQAAHIAYHLNEGTHYAIRPYKNGRVAKVLIGNQVRPGKYSELVQQMLHIKLNENAALNGEAPDFSVDPAHQIVLSLNAKSLLKTNYEQILGVSGTPGSEPDRDFYKEQFKIVHIAKLPPHEAKKTVHLPTQYHKNGEAQIAAIAKLIEMNEQHSILITCADDAEVKRIATAVQSQLLKLRSIHKDTNDSGLDEKEILLLLNKQGSVVFSSRLGRGSDPKPETQLIVCRTYPAPPCTTKQESGRTGRNGAGGSVINILDYETILNEYKKLEVPAHHSHLKKIYQAENMHLNKKIQKHREHKSDKLLVLEHDIEKYLITRTLMRFRTEMLEQEERFLREKEALVATLSREVIRIVNKENDEVKETESPKDSTKLDKLKDAWTDCRSKIEDAWNDRLTNQRKDNAVVFDNFVKKCQLHWQFLCGKYFYLDINILKSFQSDSPEEKRRPSAGDTSSIMDSLGIAAKNSLSTTSAPSVTASQGSGKSETDGFDKEVDASLLVFSSPRLLADQPTLNIG